MSEADATNVTPLHPTRMMSTREMSIWFARMSDALAKHECALEPTAFALVLINPAKVRVYSSRFPDWDLFHEAVSALADYVSQHEHPGFFSPQALRRKRRTVRRRTAARQAAYERDFPFPCAYCSDRFKTERGQRQHLHHCWRVRDGSIRPFVETPDESPRGEGPRLRLVSGEEESS